KRRPHPLGSYNPAISWYPPTWRKFFVDHQSRGEDSLHYPPEGWQGMTPRRRTTYRSPPPLRQITLPSYR
ncbi:hypothetical protein A2U01_0104506, partial [Trifolium medium]|nr:hypothetical protein [Trifolium medium]